MYPSTRKNSTPHEIHAITQKNNSSFLSIFAPALSVGEKLKTQMQLFFFALGRVFLSLILRQYLLYDRGGEGFAFIFHRTFQLGFVTDFVLGVDGVSLLLLALTAFIFPTCYLLCRSVQNEAPLSVFLLFLLFLFVRELLLLIIFQFLDLFFFYFTFEAILIPRYRLIGK